MEIKEELIGGRSGKIFKDGEYVIRPCEVWTKNVHHFLNFIHDHGGDFVPKPNGLTKEGNEIITYMPGDVYNYPLPDELLTDEMIRSSAKLLLKFHELSEMYISQFAMHEEWMLEKYEPIEIMCHGDFAPYNVTIVNNEATSMIDFDTLHPGSKMWDVAYAIYRWVPFISPKNPDSYHSLNEQIRRANIFMDTYGDKLELKDTFVTVLIERIERLISFISSEAKDGNEVFEKHIEDGQVIVLQNDLTYLKENYNTIKKGIK